MAEKLKITLVKSTIGAIPKHKKTVEALGLKKLNKTVELPDNAATRGMVAGSTHSANFRVGRGHGSGNGKTAGKGHKGQKARSGAPRPGFEGGQMPLYRRLPKRGFTNRNTKDIVSINITELNRFEDGAVVTIETLVENGVIKNPKDGVKILGNGELTKKLTVKANAFSASAAEKIQALGGTTEVI